MRLAGIQGCLVHTADETFAAIDRALKMPDLAILAITERAAEMAPDVVQQLRERGELPLLVEIPDRFGTKRGPDFLTRYVQEAIGVKM
jgi:V/A-type H+-transporting ATPase subunit F